MSKGMILIGLIMVEVLIGPKLTSDQVWNVSLRQQQLE